MHRLFITALPSEAGPHARVHYVKQLLFTQLPHVRAAYMCIHVARICVAPFYRDIAKKARARDIIL